MVAFTSTITCVIRKGKMRADSASATGVSIGKESDNINTLPAAKQGREGKVSLRIGMRLTIQCVCDKLINYELTTGMTNGRC